MEEAIAQTPREQASDPALAALAKGIEPGTEYKVSSHVLLEATDPGHTGLEILHQDLFDSATPVALSALAVLGRWRDPRSVNVITRLLNGQDEQVQSAAVQALGAIGHPGSLRVLVGLLKITKSDRLRGAILEALAAGAPNDPAVLDVLRTTSSSRLATGACRARAASLLVKLEGAPAAERLLSSSEPDTAEAVYLAAADFQACRIAVVRHGHSNYHRLSPENRRLAVTMAGATAAPDSGALVLKGIADSDPEVRRAAYQALGAGPAPLDSLPEILAQLSECVDPVLTLEEEALAGLERLETSRPASSAFPASLGQRIYGQTRALFKALRTVERQIASDSHELGWLISRSREYLEYYAEEEFRHALVNYLKGGSYYTPEKLLSMLKATAVKVEVRHFDGYKALADLIEKPKRPGIALVVRELTIVKLGKRETLYRLIRNLRLTRLLPAPPDAGSLLGQIYDWAKVTKLYRLAEASLYALMRVDAVRATAGCEECLAVPPFSKLCAIAALRLLKDLDWARMEPAVLRLLCGTEDASLQLNLLDALSSLRPRLCGDLVKSVVRLLTNGRNPEVLSRAAMLLGSLEDVDVLESVTAGFDTAEPWRQDLILALIERRMAEGGFGNREGLSEFLYRVLRSGEGSVQARAAVLLWRLDDAYALDVLQDFLHAGDPEQHAGIVRALRGAVNARLVPVLQPLLRVENANLQEAVRATLLDATDPEARAAILASVLAARGAGGTPDDPPNIEESEHAVDFEREKTAYRFEREHIQELAILFTDIQGYSRKAQTLSTMQLAALLQEYEGILLPTIAAHRGELIKKMGDGHLFVFHQPLDAALAAVRLQKAMRRFNAYREEALRVVVRVGAHWGKVVCREGDVLGNHVNIASRLESAAKGGSALISDAVYQQLHGHVHTREIGFIKVKNISEPIKVYEPYEVELDLPTELDPLKRAEATSAAATGAGRRAARTTLTLDGNGLEYLTETFATLARLCQGAERGKVPVEAIRRELAGRWQHLRGILAGSQLA